MQDLFSRIDLAFDALEIHCQYEPADSVMTHQLGAGQDGPNLTTDNGCAGGQAAVGYARMFWNRKPKPNTIGSLREAGRRLAIWCGVCNTMTYLTADETMLMPKVEPPAMEKFCPYPACGHSNGEGAAQLTARSEGH